MKLINIFVFIFICISFTGCAPKTTTKIEEFPLMYEEDPACILIFPPVNESTAADAKEYYSTTIQEPFGYCGYYTLPFVITSDIMKQEGIYDTELLSNIPLNKFKEYFGADAVLFTKIKRWDLSYMVLASSLTVCVECQLKSTTTDRILWKYNGTIVVDLSGGNSGGGIAGLIAKAIVCAINSAASDYVTYARQANYRALSTIPAGKYHMSHNKDQDATFVDQTPNN